MTTSVSDTTQCVSAHPDVAKRLSIPAVFYSLALSLLGIFLFTLVFELHDKSASISMVMMVVGSLMILYGVYCLFWRSKETVYLPTGSVTKSRSVFFDLENLSALTSMIEKNELNGESTIRSDSSGNVRMDVLLSRDNRFAAVQLFQFVPYSYAPITSVHYYIGAEAAAVSAFLARCART